MTPALTVEQIELGRTEILNNARALVEEAEILLRHERWARSYALSHLASEELAKLPMLVRAAAEVACGAPVDWKRLHKRLRDHVEKADLAMDMDFLAGHMPPEEFLSTKAAHLNRLKNDSLYVGISAGGFVAPVQAISNEAAIAMYEASRRRLRFFEVAEELTRGQIQRVLSNSEHRKRLDAKVSLKEIVEALATIQSSERGATPANNAVSSPGLAMLAPAADRGRYTARAGLTASRRRRIKRCALVGYMTHGCTLHCPQWSHHARRSPNARAA